MNKNQFVNDVKPHVPTRWDRPDEIRYQFHRAPNLLFVWSRLFQAVISQAGTFLLTGKFHEADCGIYKCEGGCKIYGVGDLVLYNTYARFDYYSKDKKTQEKVQQLNDLISHVVMNWDPINPVTSMIKGASEFVSLTTPLNEENLYGAIQKGSCGGAFGGDALSNFFDWNPFSEAPINEEYERWCRVEISKEDPTVVDQNLEDRRSGKRLLKEMNEMIRRINTSGRYVSSPMCCAPRRDKEGKLKFWINTGRTSQIDGWKTLEEIEAFIKAEQLLVCK